MSKVQTLRVVVKQRLTAAAEEIFELFERTIAEYEEELCRHRKLLDAVFQPRVQLHRTGRFCLLVKYCLMYNTVVVVVVVLHIMRVCVININTASAPGGLSGGRILVDLSLPVLPW